MDVVEKPSLAEESVINLSFLQELIPNPNISPIIKMFESTFITRQRYTVRPNGIMGIKFYINGLKVSIIFAILKSER